MQIGRKLLTLTATAGLALAGLAVAAPANAIGGVGCPTNGLTVTTSGNGNFCAAGSIGYKNTSSLFGIGQIDHVIYESTNWNWAAFYNSSGVIKLKPGQSTGYLGGVITYALEIDNPNWT
ncbi:hypothetical protein GCM10018790_63060 [Kitasatospora xanthocidica]|uniref:hypothetical protein n=1 Tax=Kitasatospora xanthocidica TaxID=83382 RepID=UPI001671F5AF|nr:hypothetical protein [Kitasatospora xanthocidica]GHF76442.1 hypothetical protein GCM10018790_63060 [Kitasatospora xanthocidica]